MQTSGSEPLRQSSVVTRQVQELKPEPRAGNSPDNDGVLQSRPVEVKTASEYSQWYKQPYAAEYFQVSPNIKSHAEQVNSIEEYVQGELQSRGFDDSLDNYRFILEELAVGMGLSGRENASLRLGKMVRWIKNIVMPQRKLEERKRRIMSA